MSLKKKLLTKRFLLSFILLVAGVALLIAAGYYQFRLNSVNSTISRLEDSGAKTRPLILYEWRAYLESVVPATLIPGLILLVLGLFALFKTIRVKTVAALSVLLFLAMAPAMVKAGAPSGPRWYASLLLEQPRDAAGIQGSIAFFNNCLADTTKPGYDPPFVAFSLVIQRVDLYGYAQEWAEAGYFQNNTGFYIYATYWLETSGYCEVDAPMTFNPGMKGDFKITNPSGNDFYMYFLSTMMLHVTMTISGDNWAKAQSESSDPENMMFGRFTDLRYLSRGDGALYSWTNRSISQDAPYAGALGIGVVGCYAVITPDTNRDGKVDIKDLAYVARSFGSSPEHLSDRWNPMADLNADGRVDIKDLALVALYFGKTI